jgi:hypothetical protein
MRRTWMAKVVDVQNMLVESFGLAREESERVVREFIMDFPLTFRESPSYGVAEDIYQDYFLE